jgi:hypothetical protein
MVCSPAVTLVYSAYYQDTYMRSISRQRPLEMASERLEILLTRRFWG